MTPVPASSAARWRVNWFSATFAVPYQESRVGSTAYAQLFELDAGAVGGISMTQGLELVGGY